MKTLQQCKHLRWLLVTTLLLTPLSIKAAGTGGYDAPYFQSDYIQSLSDWSSSLVNPALMYRVNQMHFEAGLYQWSSFSNGMGFLQGNFLYPVRRNHTLGVTFLLGGAPIQSTTASGNDSIDSRFQDIWMIGDYSYRILPWLVLGTNLKLRYQAQFGPSSISHVPGVDVGLYFNPIDHYRFGDLGFSLCFQDLVPAMTKFKYNDANINDLPSTVTANRLRAGIRYAALNDNLVFDGELVIDNGLKDIYKSFEFYREMFQSFDSVANAYKGEVPFAYRPGFHAKYMFIPDIWLKCGWTNNNIPYLGFNWNLLFPFPEMINYLNVDVHMGYSFIERSANLDDNRGFTLMGKLSSDFGPTREQKESKRLYDKLILAPMDAYNEAMRLYLAGKYWQAAFAFGKVISLFPNFHLNDKATWYMGNCYRFLYMNDAARQVYKEALEEYTTSEMRSKYLYGLQSLDYREDKFEDALKNHAFITNLYAESDIRPDADYLAGQIHFARKNYNVAEQLFSKIQPGDPTYLYAQYTLSIINVENNKEQAAIQNLMNVVRDTTQEAADQLLQDAANTKLGHLYFEMGDKLRLAVESYQRVPDGSSYGDEALLGTSWAWIKVNQPSVALQTTDRLITAHPESPLIAEANLVKGYSLMLLKRYPEAVSALELCLTNAKKTYVTEDDLKVRRGKYDTEVQQFAPISEKIKKNALRKPTNKTMEERVELEKEFTKFSKESREYFNYSLLAKSHSRFFKRKDEILQDAEYALAKATNMMKARKTNEAIQDTKQKEEELDKKLEQLKKELEEAK